MKSIVDFFHLKKEFLICFRENISRFFRLLKILHYFSIFRALCKWFRRDSDILQMKYFRYCRFYSWDIVLKKDIEITIFYTDYWNLDGEKFNCGLFSKVIERDFFYTVNNFVSKSGHWSNRIIERFFFHFLQKIFFCIWWFFKVETAKCAAELEKIHQI